MDASGWTATTAAGLEGAAIVALVVRRHRAERGRRLHLSLIVGYDGPDTSETVETVGDPDQLELPGIAEPSHTPAVTSPPVAPDRNTRSARAPAAGDGPDPDT